MSSPDRCARDECNRPRVPYSNFCDEHHREELARRFSASDTDARRGVLIAQCLRSLRAYHISAITADELHEQLYVCFVHSAREGRAECWQQCLDSLPAEAVAGLLACARSGPDPPLYSVLPVGLIRTTTTTHYEPSPADLARQEAYQRKTATAKAQVLQWLEQYTARTGRGA